MWERKSRYTSLSCFKKVLGISEIEVGIDEKGTDRSKWNVDFNNSASVRRVVFVRNYGVVG